LSEVPTFPFLTLLVSGGHTLLLLARSSNDFRVLATTPDDSIGNAYDKVSKLLSIPWSTFGPGAALEKFCAEHPSPSLGAGDDVNDTEHDILFPLPRRGELMFSYSGLYSSVHRYVEALSPETLTVERKAGVAWAFQRAAVGQLEEKLRLGIKWCSRHEIDIQHVVVSGGVASNGFLRER
jgi:N6-L-threonylcarbamoyladenine synthase